MIGGGGEKKTLRLVAKYADACNLFATRSAVRPSPHKLDVLRGHCDREGPDYDDIGKTILWSGQRIRPTAPGSRGSWRVSRSSA